MSDHIKPFDTKDNKSENILYWKGIRSHVFNVIDHRYQKIILIYLKNNK